MVFADSNGLVNQTVVTAAQMRQIEARVFAAGMPVAALMEKVGGRIARRLQQLFPGWSFPKLGILVGPGHNGADALVVARELHCQGYDVRIFHPFERSKALTLAHGQYANLLGIIQVSTVAELRDCDFLLDGLFGFGLTQALPAEIALAIAEVNVWPQPMVSIDLPSGLHTDTGEVMGQAIQATHTLCLGLWKLGLFQDQSLDYVGQAELISLDFPPAEIQAVLNESSLQVNRITAQVALPILTRSRPLATHKYQQGHLLLVAGSQRYAGSIILAGLGARATGIGMVSIAVPASLKSLVVSQIPEALVIGCPETPKGAIASLPKDIDLEQFDSIACGPGLTLEAISAVQQVLACPRPLVLDADGLNILAQLGTVSSLQERTAITVLTPHPGEFQRLFPDLVHPTLHRAMLTHQAAQSSGAMVLLKGARVAIADPQESVWINPESSPALARGGSGDVLTGLIGGLIAQSSSPSVQALTTVVAAVWWHAQTGIYAAQQRTESGVDAYTLADFLSPALRLLKQRDTENMCSNPAKGSD
jgi:ADP-dependent NAD(P)H-hydrate dehydratase / NAD(P)H-hydrate epimerase